MHPSLQSESNIFIGNSQMAALMRQYNWSKNPLGPPEEWPESLKTSLRIILKSAYPMFIWWGKELIMFHNDAYLPVLGNKHPDALGKKAKAVWAEIWEDIEGFVTEVFSGRTVYARDLELYLERLGFPEETYWTFSYSPIIDSSGEVEGLFCACNEETAKVLQKRRLQTLIDITDMPTRNTSVDQMLNSSVSILCSNQNDVPFAAVYLLNNSDNRAELVAQNEMAIELAIFDKSLKINDQSTSGWKLNKLDLNHPTLVKRNLVDDFPDKFFGDRAWADTAVVLPITKAGENSIAAILICGVSKHLPFDKEYEDYLLAAASSISRAKTDIRSHEIALKQAAVLKRAAEQKTQYVRKIELEKEKIKSIIMQAPIAMCYLKGPNHVFEIVNNSYLELIDKSREEIIDKPMLQVLPETAEQPIGSALKDVYRSGQTFTGKELPIEMYRPEKPNVGYYTFVYEPIRNLDGEVHGIMVIASEVTDQVMARQAIERQEQYFRDMANNVPVMIWTTDTKGYCTYLNKQWLSYTGQTLHEGLGLGWLKAVHADDQKMSENIFLNALEQKEGFEITYRLKAHTGDYYWHIDTGLPRFNENGVLEGYTGAVINIHERKVAEDALRKNEKELSSAISATNLGTWVYYPLTGKINWSERTNELFGLPEGANVDYEIFESGLHKDDLEKTRKAIARALNPEIREDYTIEYRTIGLVDGQMRWLKASGKAYFNENNVADIFIGSVLDITKQKAMEKQKDDFLAISSHELKTPVTSIKGYVQMLIEEFEEKKEHEAVGQLNIVNRQVNKLVLLINDLLDTSKLETGQMQFNMELFNFDDLVKEVVNSMQYVSPNHQLNLAGSTWAQILGDRNRLEQVLTNLISNAVKFSPGGGRVDISLCKKDNMIALTVEDYGIGMEPDTADQIFERFYRSPKTSHWSTGLGLGLFISSEIIKRHNGIINVNSKLGCGTKFYVKLPLSNQA